MTLAAGVKLGPYEILSPLGAGGMGEVYRANDTRLGRDVALKVLPGDFLEDEDRKKRFEREARTLATLNHPGIAAIHSFEEVSGRHLLVMELVEGEGLDVRISGGPFSLEEAVSFGRQIAEALEAAHEKGIVHRDLKPANVKVSEEGKVKLLDFGLAKALEGDSSKGNSGSGLTQSPTLTARATAAGMILGTAAYMSPEQARGKQVDKRADIWAFGCVLYEMLTGRRAFEGETVSDTLAAVLMKEPEWSALPRETPPGLRTLLRKCLVRDPRQRVHDIADARLELEEAALAFANTAAAGLGASPSNLPFEATPGGSLSGGSPFRSRFLFFLSWILAAACAAAAGALALRACAPWSALSWHRLTFENGTVLSAGFAAGGESVIYSAAWKAAPPAVYSTRIDFSESRVLVPPPSKLLSVSKSGEMAVLLRAKPLGWFVMEGTLARVPADGGAPRELLEKIMDAAWSPDGSQLVIVRAAGERVRLEFPPGRVLHETAGHITYPRFSPTGDRIAFVEHPAKLDNWGWIAVVDLEGRRTVWSPVYEMIEGLVWSPSGKELWYGAEGVRGAIQLFASGADRKTRLLASAPGDLAPLAIDAGGRMLANRLSLRAQIACAPPGDARPHDLAYLGASLLADLSPDGRRILFSYRGPGAQTTGAQTNWDVFLRPTAGGSFVRLGAAAAKALSPDGRWAAGIQWSNVFYGVPSPPGSAGESGTSIVLLPTGAGEPRRIGMKQEAIIRAIAFHPDGRRLVLSAAVPPGQSPEQLWVMEISENPVLHSISPPGFYAVTSGFLSPDGRLAAATDPEERLWLVPVEGGEPRRIPGIEEGEKFAGWTGDGKAVYVYRYTDRVTLHRIEIASGARRPWKEASLPDAAGAQEPYAVIVASGAEAWAAGYQSLLGELYLVEGLK